MPTHFDKQVVLYEPTMKLLHFLKVLDKLRGCSSQTIVMLRYCQSAAPKPAKGRNIPLSSR